MQRKVITTADGSKTIQIEEWDEQYHSVHGAIQEANHVFIKHGLLFYFETILKTQKSVSILEIGFGTGLNAFISLLNAEKSNFKINYVGVEAYPVIQKEIEFLNYNEILAPNSSDNIFKKMHQCAWEATHQITRNFTLTKQEKFFKNIADKEHYNLIYYDAFGARLQPELWTEVMFSKMYRALKDNGVLVTYSAKGSVRRAMQAVGFKVERLPGPPGKREMLRAIKD